MFCVKCGKKVNKRTLACKRCGTVAVLEGNGNLDAINEGLLFAADAENTYTDENTFEQKNMLSQKNTGANNSNKIILAVIAVVVCVVLGVVAAVSFMDDEPDSKNETNGLNHSEMNEEEKKKPGGSIIDETDVKIVGEDSKENQKSDAEDKDKK